VVFSYHLWESEAIDHGGEYKQEIFVPLNVSPTTTKRQIVDDMPNFWLYMNSARTTVEDASRTITLLDVILLNWREMNSDILGRGDYEELEALAISGRSRWKSVRGPL